uniref:Uncharacterized protein n=1 Tax=Avena sativa TaxID=4498 RepID=A0ACD5UJC8_AVESA
MRPPPAQRGRNSPPELIEDAMSEIFLRIPANDPKSLVRAAAVCTTWRRILRDLVVLSRQYRAFHGAPPMLGFFHHAYHEWQWGEVGWFSSFVSTASFRSPACRDRLDWHVLDSRHGLALFYTPRMIAEFVVCDLVTSKQWKIRTDPKCDDIMRCWKREEEEQEIDRINCSAAVLCANDRCDHLDCHGGPFRIALVGSVYFQDGRKTLATVYSSETCKWSDMISVENPKYINFTGQSAFVGNNKVYAPCDWSDNVVEYNMDEQKLSVIHTPDTDHPKCIHLMGVEQDGMLLFASVMKPRLFLWSMEVGPKGAVGWARHWIIDLGPDVLSHMSDVSAVGFAEGVCVIFLSTLFGLYTVDINSGQGKKVHDRHMEKVIPCMSFYTGEWGRLPTSRQASRAVVGATAI